MTDATPLDGGVQSPSKRWDWKKQLGRDSRVAILGYKLISWAKEALQWIGHTAAEILHGYFDGV